MNKEQAVEKSKHILNLFMEIRNEFKEVELSKSVNGCDYSIYFKGNKTLGDDYDLNMWKKVPIISSTLSKYTGKDEWFLDLRINYSGSSSSEDYLLSDNELKNKFRKSFKNCIQDFIETKI